MTNISKNKLKVLKALFNTFAEDMLLYIDSFEGQSYDAYNPKPDFRKDIYNRVCELKEVTLYVVKELEHLDD